MFNELQDIVPVKPAQTYQPRVYGFRVNEASLYYKNREEDERYKNSQSNSNSSSNHRNTQTGADSVNNRGASRRARSGRK
jgi:hypothetical protein